MSEINVNDIAIISMDCRIPKADNIDAMWKILQEGNSVITDLTKEELDSNNLSSAVVNDQNYVKRGGILEDIDKFDITYFDMNAREAEVLDVQQRMMLQASVTLLNRGNINIDNMSQRIGVFVGSAFSTYLFGILERSDLIESLGEMVIRHSNDKDFLSTRISYKLNLNGPSLNIQTACSTGLVTVNSAIQSLLLGECDIAIAGAVHIKLPQNTGYLYTENGVLSPDGICRPFDASSNGTIFTNGLGLVLLKRLKDAIDDGDNIEAVIVGSAVNNDGSKKVSFTAPSVTGQVEVLRSAIEIANIDPSKIQYIEAHGTGTQLGDPIEIEAIKQAYGIEGIKCGIGSSKGNFGHLNIAAGIVGLIKSVLILKHKYIPATINISQTNPKLNLKDTRFFITQEKSPLDISEPQYSAVSAFGMGGTNAHVILRSFDSSPLNSNEHENTPQLFVFSAKSEDSINQMAINFANFLEKSPKSTLINTAYTAFHKRQTFPIRASLVAFSKEEAISKFKKQDFYRCKIGNNSKLAYIFAGQGSQQVYMGRQLADSCKPFKYKLEEALNILNKYLDFDPAEYLWNEDRSESIKSTLIAQPIIFAIEYALATTFIELNIIPDFLIGHSLGELVAATVSGVFSLEIASEIIAKRASYMSECDSGTMVVVECLENFKNLINDDEVSIAAYNSPQQYVLSGSNDSIEKVMTLAENQGLVAVPLSTSHAFHSPMMGSAADNFRKFLGGVFFNDARIPIISNITGKILTEYEYKNPNYWSDHILRTVQFSESINTLKELGVNNFIEIGSGQSMSNILKANFFNSSNELLTVVPSLKTIDSELDSFLNVIAFSWSYLPDISIEAYIKDGQPIQIPVYPFSQNVYWIPPVIGFRPVKPLESCNNQKDEQILSVDIVSDSASLIDCENSDVKSSEKSIVNKNNGERNPVEDIVTEVYTRYLGSKDIDKEVAFFNLGGNSLLAIQLVNKLRETFKLDIPLRVFNESSSVIGISNYITNMLIGESEDE